jgi:aspartyl-tRNA(Asn)/glutamyl-tRNA(Gln) amidotransferase subunit A
MPANIAGIPGISVPGGLSDGLPVGFQVMGPAMGEQTLLKIAYAYEQATMWNLKYRHIIEQNLS